MAKGKTIAIILAACAGIGILVIASCAGLIFMGFKNADANVSPRIDAMFSAIENDTFAATYETETTQQLRNETTKEPHSAIARFCPSCGAEVTNAGTDDASPTTNSAD